MVCMLSKWFQEVLLLINGTNSRFSSTMFSLTAVSLAFTSPSALLAVSTQRAAVSMGYYANSADAMPSVGMWPNELNTCRPLEYDGQATLNPRHTNYDAAPTVAAPPVPVDSVAQMVGTNQYAWPAMHDRQATLGVSSGHTNYADGASVPAPVVVPEPVVGKVVPVAAEEAVVEEATAVEA